ncbi:MAG: hypothetical protein ACK5PP_07660, partial [Acidimicrobiales bacterium]
MTDRSMAPLGEALLHVFADAWPRPPTTDPAPAPQHRSGVAASDPANPAPSPGTGEPARPGGSPAGQGEGGRGTARAPDSLTELLRSTRRLSVEVPTDPVSRSTVPRPRIPPRTSDASGPGASDAATSGESGGSVRLVEPAGPTGTGTRTTGRPIPPLGPVDRPPVVVPDRPRPAPDAPSPDPVSDPGGRG